MLHKIFDPQFAKSIYARDPESDDEESFFSAQPSDEKHARRLKFIQKMIKDPNAGYRLRLTPHESMITALENQKSLFPNMVEVIEFIQRSIAFSIHCGKGLDLPAIILNGGPGVGKTRFVKALARILGTKDRIISVNTLTSSDYLCGLPNSFNGSAAGCIAEELIQGETAAPLFVLDEIEKFAPKGSTSHFDDLYNLLHSYFERENATNVMDEYLQIPFDCSQILWLMTSNSLEKLPLSFLDRVTIIDIAPLTREQNYTIIKKLFNEVIGNQGPPIILSEEALIEIAKYGLSTAQRLIKNAIGHMLLEKRQTLTKADIMKVSQQNNQTQKIGFI